MKRKKRFLVATAVLYVVMNVAACATAPSGDHSWAVKDGTMAQSGDTVHLFGGGETGSRKAALNTVVPVYRLASGYCMTKQEVGKVKLTKSLGDRYVEAVVLEGEVRSRDVAVQGNNEFLVTLPETASLRASRVYPNWGF